MDIKAIVFDLTSFTLSNWVSQKLQHAYCGVHGLICPQ